MLIFRTIPAAIALVTIHLVIILLELAPTCPPQERTLTTHLTTDAGLSPMAAFLLTARVTPLNLACPPMPIPIRAMRTLIATH